MTNEQKNKLFWISYVLLLALAIAVWGCGKDENGTETQDDAGTTITDTYDAGPMVSDTKPGTMATKDAAPISQKRDTGLGSGYDSMPTIPVFDSGSGANPYACYARNCAYPEVGCCWIDDDHTLCNVSASCSVPGWEIFGCKCEVKK